MRPTRRRSRARARAAARAREGGGEGGGEGFRQSGGPQRATAPIDAGGGSVGASSGCWCVVSPGP